MGGKSAGPCNWRHASCSAAGTDLPGRKPKLVGRCRAGFSLLEHEKPAQCGRRIVTAQQFLDETAQPLGRLPADRGGSLAIDARRVGAVGGAHVFPASTLRRSSNQVLSCVTGRKASPS